MKKVKRGKDEEVNGQWGRGVPRPHTGPAPEGNTGALRRYDFLAPGGTQNQFFPRASSTA